MTVDNGQSSAEHTQTLHTAAVRARGLDDEWSWHDAVVGKHWHRRASALCSRETEIEPDFVDINLQWQAAPLPCSKRACGQEFPRATGSPSYSARH